MGFADLRTIEKKRLKLRQLAVPVSLSSTIQSTVTWHYDVSTVLCSTAKKTLTWKYAAEQLEIEWKYEDYYGRLQLQKTAGRLQRTADYQCKQRGLTHSLLIRSISTPS